MKVKKYMKKKTIFMKCMSQILNHEKYEMLDYYIANRKKMHEETELQYRKPYFYAKRKSAERYCIFRFTMEGPLLLAIAKQYVFIAEWAKKNGYIPIIDLEYEQVYKEGRIGEDNMWEYCFQPELPIKEVLKKDHVFVEALYSNYYGDTRICLSINGKEADYAIHVCQENWRKYHKNVNKYVKKHLKFNETFEKKFKSEVEGQLVTGNILGVSLREEFSKDVAELVTQKNAIEGLAKHPLSDGVKGVLKVVKKYMQVWKVDKIFLSTICQETIDIFRDEFGEKIIAVNRKRQTLKEMAQVVDRGSTTGIKENYMWHLQSGIKEREYEQAVSYLQEVVALSKCQYLIAMKSSGTVMALALNGGQYKDIYIMPDINSMERY